MPTVPRSTKSSKTGSNLENAAARLASRKEALDAKAAKYTRAQAAFRRQLNQILTKPVVRKMTPVVETVRLEYARATLAAAGDPARLRAAEKRAQKTMTDALKKEVPRFGELRQQSIAYEKAFGTLVKRDFAAARVDQLPATLGQLEPVGPRPQIATPPYRLFDVTPPPGDPLDFDFNDSFVDLPTGNLVTNVQFRHNEHAWGGFNPGVRQTISTSVGVNVTVPATGFLTCSAVIENLFNRITVSASDNFGVSHAFVSFDVVVFIELVRSGESTLSTRTMLHDGLTSRGSDLRFSTSAIPAHRPFTLRFDPRDAFLKGEVIQLMVGSSVTVVSHVDDMDVFLEALLMWQVRSIVVGMKP